MLIQKVSVKAVLTDACQSGRHMGVDFPDLARSGKFFFFFEKKNFPDSQIWPDLARSGNKISTSGKRARSGKLAPKSGQIWQHPCLSGFLQKKNLVFSHGFTHFHLVSHGFTHFHMASHIFTWFHTFSHIFTWFHLVSHIFT